MKSVIFLALGEMIQKNFGQDKWNEILKSAGIDPKIIFLATDEILDETMLNIIKKTCKILNINMEQAADAFGEYWVNEYAPRIYKAYYLGCKNARDFITKMDYVHVSSTKNIPGSKPPRFKYEWEDNNTLIMTYISQRKLIDIMIGLIKGVGKYYKEDLKVYKISDDKVRIVFPS